MLNILRWNAAVTALYSFYKDEVYTERLVEYNFVSVDLVMITTA